MGNGPTVAADCGGVKHGPGDHESEQRGDRGGVGLGGHGAASDDDGPEHEDDTATDEALTSGNDVSEADGGQVGKELESGGDCGQAEGVGLADEFEVVGLVGVCWERVS